MPPTLPYGLLADAVLLLHFAVVVFVVGGLPLIVLGQGPGWAFVNTLAFRLAHLSAIGVVVAQAWLGQHCFLTHAESWLRHQAGEAGYASSFVQHWVHRVLFHEAPLWQFAVVYTVFGLLVLWAWWRYPPRRALRRRNESHSKA